MVSVSDIVKILDQVPIWRTLKALPGRIDALEKRVNDLESRPKQADHLHTCELCGKPAKVTDVREHPTFGVFGRKQRTITCEDGHAIDYDWEPGKT